MILLHFGIALFYELGEIYMQKEQNKRYILGSCFYAFFINGITGLILGSLLPYLTQTYQLDYQVSGLLLSSHSVGNLVAGFIAGALPLYLGRKRSILLLCSATALGFIGMVLTGNPVLLLLSFLFTGIGRGSVSNFNNVIVTETSDGNPKALNILHSFFAIGAFIAPFLVLCFTQKQPVYWKWSSLSVAVLSCVMIGLFGFMKLSGPSSMATHPKQQRSFSFLKDSGFWISSGILFFYLCAETAINGWLVTYFKDSGIMTDGYAQTLASLLWLVILFGRLTCAYLSQFVSKQKLLVGTAAGTVVFFVLLLSTRDLTVITISIIGLGFVLAVMMANSGGAWDNAKKYIESGEHGGKGSDQHKAAVVGDTVGDPFKDTSGPSINILIKLTSMVSIVFAGLIVAVHLL